MSDEEEWAKLSEAATPGPWIVRLGTPCSVWPQAADTFRDRQVARYVSDEDAAFIAAAREAVPALLAEVTRLRTLPENCATISATVTASYPVGMDPELVMRRRVGKVFVEAGELADAIEGWTGENPRKGAYATEAEVVKELLDCASASLCAVEHLTGDKGLSLGMLADHVAGNASRLAAALAAPLGETPGGD